MIDLLARDPLSSLGFATILETEKIPYRRIADVEEACGPLVVQAQDLSADEIDAIANHPTLVLGGGGRFLRTVFDVRDGQRREGPCTISLGGPVWTHALVELARWSGTGALTLPHAPWYEIDPPPTGDILAVLATLPSNGGNHGVGGTRPAVMERGRCVWSAVDLGATFAHLLSDGAAPAREPDGSARDGNRGSTEHVGLVSTLARHAWTRRLTEDAYYAAPSSLRRWLQHRAAALLAQRLEAASTPTSRYPIDTTGWLLIELVKILLHRINGPLVHLARWPAPFSSAAALTHDVEPTRFAYTRGLTDLLDGIDAIGHPATLGLVARPSVRYISGAAVARIQRHEVLCHGLTHRGEPFEGRARMVARLRSARAKLELLLRHPVQGYRSPRLERSPDLAWALDAAGFLFDSSHPDVDRENLAHFGGGVRLNVPYRPILLDGADLRPSRCLELPLTAPDCIQPLFAGESVDDLHRMVTAKATFLRLTGGLYVALVHGGVFGTTDAALRGDHLRFVAHELAHPKVWLASLADIAAWWRGREALDLQLEGATASIVNRGTRPIAGVRLVIEHPGAPRVVALPPIGARAAVEVSLREPAARSLQRAPASLSLPYHTSTLVH